jgi:hypothetical protein
MQAISMDALHQKITELQDRVTTEASITDHVLIRALVAETALGFLIGGKAVDFDQVEKVLTEEVGSSPKRASRLQSAIADLRARVANPTTPQTD